MKSQEVARLLLKGMVGSAGLGSQAGGTRPVTPRGWPGHPGSHGGQQQLRGAAPTECSTATLQQEARARGACPVSPARERREEEPAGRPGEKAGGEGRWARLRDGKPACRGLGSGVDSACQPAPTTAGSPATKAGTAGPRLPSPGCQAGAEAHALDPGALLSRLRRGDLGSPTRSVSPRLWACTRQGAWPALGRTAAPTGTGAQGSPPLPPPPTLGKEMPWHLCGPSPCSAPPGRALTLSRPLSLTATPVRTAARGAVTFSFPRTPSPRTPAHRTSKGPRSQARGWGAWGMAALSAVGTVTGLQTPLLSGLRRHRDGQEPAVRPGASTPLFPAACPSRSAAQPGPPCQSSEHVLWTDGRAGGDLPQTTGRHPAARPPREGRGVRGAE